MKIAAVQMVSTPDVARNCDAARRLIAQAAARGAELVALPEYFCLMGRNDRDKLDVAELPLGEQGGGDSRGGPIQQALSAAALAHSVWLIGGTLPLRCADPQRVRNSCLVFAPDGSLAARYDKMHLFRFDSGRERYDEGRVLEAGSEPVALQCGALRVGLSVCYDLRFPELYRAMQPVDLILVPSAFTATTGRAHWETLLRARAIENLCYVLAAAQGGRHANGRDTHGDSMLVDPWGAVVSRLPTGPGVVSGEIDPAFLERMRANLPALEHRTLGRETA